jgi:hypothetical protein
MKAAFVIALALAGCSTIHEIKVPETIYVPTPIPCIRPEKLPTKPVLRSQAEILLLDDYRATHALWAAYGRALGYVGQLEVIADGCSRIQSAP